jgi:hypothetical protein
MLRPAGRLAGHFFCRSGIYATVNPAAACCRERRADHRNGMEESASFERADANIMGALEAREASFGRTP